MLLARRFTDLEGTGVLLDGAHAVSYGAAAERAGRIAALLDGEGLRAGDRVALSTRDEREATALVLGCLRAGLALLPIDADVTGPEARALLRHGQPQASFIDRGLLADWGLDAGAAAGAPQGLTGRLFPIAAQARPRLVDRLLGRRPAAEAAAFPGCLDALAPSPAAPAAPPPETPALLLPTSGTTSAPRLVCWSREVLESQLLLQAEQLRLGPGARVLNLLPFLYGDGLNLGLPLAFSCGATLVRVPAFTVSRVPEVLDAVYRHRVTHLVLVPALLALLLQLGEDLREALGHEGFRFVISTGAPLPAALWRRFEEASGRRVVNVYGLTETGNLFFAGPDDASHRVGTVGRPLRCEARLVDGEGRDVPPGEPGELWLRGPALPPGYLGAPPRRPEDWVATGDLLRRDDEGRYEVVGRRKAVIIVGGRNVFPDEVDQALSACPLVAESATVGEADEIFGERVVSYVVPRDPGATEQALQAHVAAQLSPYKVPTRVRLVAALPRGPAGKVQLEKLGALGGADVAGAAPRGGEGGDVTDAVFALAAACFRLPIGELSGAVTPGRTRGWDSLAHLDFVTRLEQRFSLQLSPQEVMGIDSLDAAVRTVRQRLWQDAGRPR